VSQKVPVPAGTTTVWRVPSFASADPSTTISATSVAA
jgi:hypothetical protein